VEIDERVYFPLDYSHPLSQERIDEIEKRVSEGLHHLGIQHCFVRTGKPNA